MLMQKPAKSFKTRLNASSALKKLGNLLVILMSVGIILSLASCSKENFVGMLNPKGIIAYHERKLFFDTLALMLIVVLPVIIMSFAFAYHYQESHRVRDYKPNWSHSYFLEGLWWGIPCVIIAILAVMTWKKTHELDPYRPLSATSGPTLIVQAIALPWKWLFIYPQQNIATVNYLELPVNQQVEFWITADNAAMADFFIPQIGSQVYAMAGMRTRLHLIGNQVGTYEGLNAQYNGDGFSDMHFDVHVVTADEFKKWTASTKKSSLALTTKAYEELLKPTDNNKPTYYSSAANNLFDNVLSLYHHSHGKYHPRDVQASN